MQLKDTWERFLLYLPMVVMAVLALGSYWLVRSTPVADDRPQENAVRHHPDYFVKEFALKSFDVSGKVRTEVFGTEARHYPDTQWLEVDNIRILSYDEKGRLTVGTAKRGLTNEDISQVQLLGNAVIVREAADNAIAANSRMEYRSEFLDAYLQTEQVRSNKPVEIMRGKDKFTADSLDFDNVEQVLKLKGRVRGTLQPGNQ